MVDFSFIVSLYVSDLPNVTISTVRYLHVPVWLRLQQERLQILQEIATMFGYIRIRRLMMVIILEILEIWGSTGSR